jgi:uncharacterized paraquat-inducible protein A
LIVDSYAPQQVIIQQVAPVIQPAYIDADMENPRHVVTCPSCGQQVDCTGIPRGARASCPYCKKIIY